VDTARVREIYTPAAGGSGGQVGSAYRIGPEAVLTAAHVVAGLPVWPVYDEAPGQRQVMDLSSQPHAGSDPRSITSETSRTAVVDPNRWEIVSRRSE